jgi:hypothetical protein
VTAFIGRREAITLVGGAAAAWSVVARAQQVERMRRIGVLMHGTSDEPESQGPSGYDFRKAQVMQLTSGWVADALHPVFEAPAVSVSVRARRRSPLHAPRNRIRELQ